MSNARAPSASASLPGALEERVRMIAVEENRSAEEVTECAVRVFTLFPKEVRDALVETSADDAAAKERFREISRQIMFNAAKDRFDAAMRKMAEIGEPDKESLLDDEATIVESRI